MYRKFVLLFAGFFTLQCSQTESPTASSPADGKTLAHSWCGTCHVFTEPALLPKSVWINKVLPNMATRMGIPMGFPYDKLEPEDMQAVINARVIPDKPMLREEDMLKIVQYFAENAPQSPLSQQRGIAPQPGLSLFEVKTPGSRPISTQNIMLKPLNAGRQLLLGFEDKGTWLYDFRQKNARPVSTSASSDAALWGGKLYLLDLLATKAYNLPKGCIWALEWNNGRETGAPQKIIGDLIRPVSMDVSDVNADGQPDFIVCEFGDYLGRLTLQLSAPQGYKRVLLKDYPGACKAYFKDMNGDGKEDIVALMSQAKEEICLFLNTGTLASYTEKSVAVFPPCYGSNSMEIADLNGDGHPDILTTQGDNADMSTSLKPYHGIRLFLNDGAGNFTMAWFYPMHGASKVMAGDFDLDGRTDMAVIAHFPDFSQKNTENFLFFKGNKTSPPGFTPLQFPQPLNGRLLTMEKMDVDADGDEDILIGNFVDMLTEPGGWYSQWTAQPRDWWILKNKTRS